MIKSFIYYPVRLLAIILKILLIKLEIKGEENIPATGPCIVTANHLHAADPPLLGFCMGRKTTYIAKEELFSNRLFARFITAFGAIPVRRGRMNRDALRKAGEALAQGKRLVIFPEGRRSRGTLLKTTYAGAAMITARSMAPILPVGISGTEAIKGIGCIFRHPRVVVNIGTPFYLPTVDGKVDRNILDSYTYLIMKRIAELLPERYRGEYTDTKQG